ncbi:MAG TPA: 3-phosphoserine/phosphohydroxythreonine transaminase, partial [Pirellulaceae bacterium]|nr:3-phosphoserine/phosphohydroxythreonine transaminase [Pirellulaceae bacterium]
MAATTTPKRVYNFSSGPAMLPLTVLEQAQAELLSLGGSGMSVLEVSHRSDEFIAILQETKSNLKKLLSIPDNYQVVFLQGGSRLQFSMIPMNLLRGQTAAADYVLTGTWGNTALAEAKREGEVRVAWDGKETNYDRLPAAGELKLNPNAAYVHITSNETIQGIQFQSELETGGAPLVCDSSSDIFYRPLDISKYGLLYACAQKNAGPAGVTAVIIRDDLLARSQDNLPGYLNYKSHVKEDSMYNTPPCFSIYIMGLVLKWLINDIGGLEKMHAQNKHKAKLLYDVVDGSNGFYQGHAQPENRSLMNVTFRMPSPELEKKFVAEAAALDLYQLKGHRSV